MDISDVTVDGFASNFCYAAYTRIKEMKDIPASPSSCCNRLRAEVTASMSPDSTNTSFIPFVRERNSVGKLLSTEEPSPKRNPFPRQSSVSVTRRTGIDHVAKLKKPRPKAATPGVGTYETNSFWAKKSYCQRRKSTIRSISPKPVTTPKRPFFASPKAALVPVYQYVVKDKRERPHAIDKFEGLRPEVALRRMKKTNFQSVKLIDSPDELMESFQFVERRKLKEEKLFEVKRFMRRMLKGKFY